MKKKLLLMLTACLLAGVSYAQTLTVTGRVVESDTGLPAYLAIMVKGTTVATSTDMDGRYSITVASPNTAVLVFSGVGYATLEVPVNGRAVIDTQVSPDAQSLTEVVVTAYGTQTKKAFTGTASTIRSSAIENLQVSSVSKALQGLASGVLVVSGSGQPGENATIRVRGIGSLSASSDPLIVVDGVVFSGNLNSINPADIETFTVLKDANSTALYGSRAANGVILITTKIGRPGESRITVNASYGLNSRAVKDYEYLSPKNYMELHWERAYMDLVRSGQADATARQTATNNLIPSLVYNPFSVDNPIGTDGKLVAGAKLNYQEDWYDALFRVGRRQDYSIQAMGGNQNSQYLISGALLDEDGTVKMSNYTRYNVRGKVDAKLKDWLKVGINLNLAYSKSNTPTQSGSSTRSSVLFVRGVSSIYPAYQRNRDGSFRLDQDGEKQLDYGRRAENGNVWGADRPVFPGQSPLGTFINDDISSNRFTTNSSGYIDLRIMEGLNFKTVLGIDHIVASTKQYYNNLIGDGAAYGGLSTREKGTTTVINWSNILTYDKSFGESHINLLAGTESYEYAYEYLAAQRRGFDFADQELNYGTNLIQADSYLNGERSFRYIGRVNYDLKDKYHLSASITHDGTSRFHKNNRWGTFWSVGAAWNIGGEPFMASINKTLTELKLRLSYGTSGNKSLSGYFPYMGTYDTGYNIIGNGGSVIYALGNDNLRWEKNAQIDIGIDYALFGNRVSGSFTYYDRESDDLLMSRPLPLSAGITSYNDNVGAVRNNGLEIDARGLIMSNKDFRWDVTLNLTFQKNRMTALPEEQAAGFVNGNYWRGVGHAIYAWYLPEFVGVDPENGRPMWYVDETDANGNVTGKTTTYTASQGTRHVVGDAQPKMLGGIGMNISYKGFYFSTLASFTMGGKLLDTDKASLMHMFGNDRLGYQGSVDMLNRWTEQNRDTDVPRLIGSTESYGNASTKWLVKGDYLRVRNITLGYDLSKLGVLKNTGIKGLKVYASGDNLFTLFGSKGLDPETGLNGVTSNSTSSMKVISFGLNVQL